MNTCACCESSNVRRISADAVECLDCRAETMLPPPRNRRERRERARRFAKERK